MFDSQNIFPHSRCHSGHNPFGSSAKHTQLHLFVFSLFDLLRKTKKPRRCSAVCSTITGQFAKIYIFLSLTSKAKQSECATLFSAYIVVLRIISIHCFLDELLRGFKVMEQEMDFINTFIDVPMTTKPSLIIDHHFQLI